MKKLLVVPLGYIILAGCSVNEEKLNSGFWKCNDGTCGLGDFVAFKGAKLMHDTIFIQGKPTYIILDSKISFLKEEIIIQSIITGNSGIYVNK